MAAPAYFAPTSRLLLLAALCLAAHRAPATEADPPPALPASPTETAAIANPVVMTVNGEPVTTAEYRLVMRRHVAAIFGQFSRDKKLEDHAGYWSPDSGPEGPLAKLRERVAAELVKIKVRQILGRKHGLVADLSFDAFRKKREAENARRADAVQAGQIIYGPRHYPFSAYYYLQLRDLEFRLKQALVREFSADISDSEIARHYSEHEAAFAKKPLAEVRLGIIEVLAARKATALLERLGAEATVTTDASRLAEITPRSDPAVASAPPATLSAPSSP